MTSVTRSRSNSFVTSPSSRGFDFTDLEKKTHGSLVVSNKPTMPTWVPDNEVTSCMLCDKSFSTFSRKHHCRNCGFVVCKACSRTRAAISQTSARVRVCDRCVTDLDLSSSNSTTVADEDDTIIGSPEPNRVSHTHAQSDPKDSSSPTSSPQLLGVIDVPAWSYAFKPFSEHGASIRVGRAMVKIVSTNNVPLPPNMQSYDATSLSCTLRVGEYSVSSTRVPLTAGTITHSVSAVVDQPFILDVSSGSQSIRLQLAQHVNGLNLPLGFVNVPVSSLDHQTLVTLTLPLEGTFRAVNTNSPEHMPSVTIEAQYLFNKAGHFWSQFATEPVPLSTRPFMLATFLRDLMFAVYHCRLLLRANYMTHMLMSWSLPVLSLVAVGLLLFSTHNRFIIVLLFHMFLWRYFIMQYRRLSVVEETKPQEGQSLQPYHIEQLASLCPGSSEDVSLTGTMQSVTDMQLSELMQDFLEQMLPLCGLGSLTDCDKGLYMVNNTFRHYQQFANWERPVITACLFLLSIVSCFFIFNSQPYVWAAIGLTFLCCKAPLVSMVGTVVNGIWKGK